VSRSSKRRLGPAAAGATRRFSREATAQNSLEGEALGIDDKRRPALKARLNDGRLAKIATVPNATNPQINVETQPSVLACLGGRFLGLRPRLY
jgi:hypothetical protein